MTIETKQTANETVYALTAENVMDRNCLIIPQQMLVREATRLLLLKRSHVAAVVDENGRYANMLRAADVFRWIDAGCPKVVVGASATCPYQVQGRLLNGDEALICTLSHGSCVFQTEIPTTGGRHTDVCARQETADNEHRREARRDEQPSTAHPQYLEGPYAAEFDADTPCA